MTYYINCNRCLDVMACADIINDAYNAQKAAQGIIITWQEATNRHEKIKEKLEKMKEGDTLIFRKEKLVVNTV